MSISIGGNDSSPLLSTLKKVDNSVMLMTNCHFFFLPKLEHRKIYYDAFLHNWGITVVTLLKKNSKDVKQFASCNDPSLYSLTSIHR
jgi:hypothetical protein